MVVDRMAPHLEKAMNVLLCHVNGHLDQQTLLDIINIVWAQAKLVFQQFREGR
jgi:hypothetical protein